MSLSKKQRMVQPCWYLKAKSFFTISEPSNSRNPLQPSLAHTGPSLANSHQSFYAAPPHPYFYTPYAALHHSGFNNGPFNDPLIAPTPFLTPQKRQFNSSLDCSSAPTSKRARASEKENTPSPAVPESPESTISGPAAPLNFVSMLSDKGTADPATKSKSATDVWYFVFPVSSNDDAKTLQIPKDIKPSETLKRPKDAAFIACRLCPATSRSVWKCTEGQTTSIRTHLQDKHWKVYSEAVISKKLKGWESIARNGGKRSINSQTGVRTGEREPFTLDGFYKRLAKWIVVDDQSINVVECPELRDLLLYLNADINDNEIPHRKKLTQIIKDQFEIEYKNMVEEIQSSLGDVSATTDLWSRQNLCPHMGMTVHFMATRDNQLTLESRLVAFRALHGSHTGVRMAEEALDILKGLGILRKIGMITLDNASNNNTMMTELARLLSHENDFIIFDAVENRIRCFPHVINICVKTGLKFMTKIPDSVMEVPAREKFPETDLPANVSEPVEINDNVTGSAEQHIPVTSWTGQQSNILIDPQYRDALESDVVTAVRKFVNTCRASDQRRMALRNAINHINEVDPLFVNDHLPQVELLRDVDTRWSSTFLMIERFLLLLPAIKYMISKFHHKTELGDLMLSETQLHVLNDIHNYLYIFHLAQQIVFAEKTPTLSLVLPIYQRLNQLLKDAKNVLPGISHAINASRNKLEEYMGKARRTKAYTLAMAINPIMKLEWPVGVCTATDRVEAKRILRNAMLQRRRAMRASGAKLPDFIGRRKVGVPSSKAAQAQGRCHAKLNALARSLSSGSLTGSTSHVQLPESTPSESSTQLSEAELLKQDEAAVDDELQRWIDAGIITDDDEMNELDLVVFWQCHKFEFPLLYHIALDILPAQASAVPCERVFSSSKETDSDRRSRLDSDMMEKLQILKYCIRSNRLNFTEGLLASESECTTVLDIDSQLLEDMIMAGDIEQLEWLIDSSQD